MALLLLLLLAVLAFPAPAAASKTQETILQDDPKLIFPDSTPALDRTLGMLAALGVDRIRVSVFWDLFGPAPRSNDRPTFERGPADPRSYEPDAWTRYDRIVRLAAKHSLAVLLSPTGPAPAWAAGRKPDNVNIRHVRDPDPGAFRDFVQAVGRRYDGTWPDPGGTSGATLPAVDHWSLWNEPNYPSWLWPQWRGRRRRRVPSSPRLYRRLVDGGYAGLKASGHKDDVILLGETSPGGATGSGLAPVAFVRELYCLNPRYQPYQGRQARLRGCPTTPRSRAFFSTDHPGLFGSRGWAHHAYSLFFPPTYHDPDPENVTIGDLPRLTRALDRTLRRWGQVRAKPDVWVTEHGYQTKPPDPYAKVTPAQQALWLAQTDFLSFLNPRVASTAQFLLYDDMPRARFKRDRKQRMVYWGTWQSGLLTAGGAHKPAFDSYRLPLWVTPARVRRGRQVRVWAQYRPGAPGAALTARVEFLGRGQSEWRKLAEQRVADEHGTLDTRVDPPGPGALRVVWGDPARSEPQPSRAAGVQVIR